MVECLDKQLLHLIEDVVVDEVEEEVDHNHRHHLHLHLCNLLSVLEEEREKK